MTATAKLPHDDRREFNAYLRKHGRTVWNTEPTVGERVTGYSVHRFGRGYIVTPFAGVYLGAQPDTWAKPNDPNAEMYHYLTESLTAHRSDGKEMKGDDIVPKGVLYSLGGRNGGMSGTPVAHDDEGRLPRVGERVRVWLSEFDGGTLIQVLPTRNRASDTKPFVVRAPNGRIGWFHLDQIAAWEEV